MNGQRVQLACANCFWHRNKREDGKGDCWRHPPTPVVVMMPAVDVQRASQGMQQRFVAVRATTAPVEFCGEFMGAPEPAAMPMSITTGSEPH